MSSVMTKECSICFESIGNTNCCSLKCSHEFCFSCISQYIATTARNDYTQDITCPMCRDLLIEGEEEQEEEDEEDDDDDTVTLSDSSIISDGWLLEPDEDGNIINLATMFHEPRLEEDDDEVYDEQDENVANIEVVTQHLAEKGFTMIDLASILFNRYKRNDPKYTNKYINRMIENVYEIIDKLDEIADNEFNERELFAQEDVRV